MNRNYSGFLRELGKRTSLNCALEDNAGRSEERFDRAGIGHRLESVTLNSGNRGRGCVPRKCYKKMPSSGDSLLRLND